MKNTTTIVLVIDNNIMTSLVKLAEDESRLDQYLETVIEMLAGQQTPNKEILAEHIRLIKALIAKLHQSQAEILTLRNQLRQIIATTQDLLALRNPPSG